ncbi:TPR Domain containing protein [Histomonas meleagridis]|nr:TPR Domain containing protein [Histomonas meleagridis]
MLGKNLLPTIQKDKYEEIETPRQEYFQQERKYKPITHEKAQELEYKALTSEGRSLYFRSYYSRAIESFSKALDINKEDYSLYVDRANCYIQIGDARSAIIDANTVLQVSPNDTRALLAKAEAFFSIGEFEFALVFFERGSFLRQDIQGFREGITKCKHAILDSINGEKTYQPNPNFSASRIRKQKHLHHNNKNKKRNDESENEDEEEEENQYEQENLEELLPEKVHPLTINP